MTADRRSYHLVAVDQSPYLTATLERAQGAAAFGELERQRSAAPVL